MSLMKEFRDFAMRGNVVDLAVGVIIGGAFGKIVNSVVNDMIMPPIGYLIGGVKFTDLKFVTHEATLGADGKEIPAVTLNYGNFIQMVFEFIIIAFSIFMMVKLMNRLNRIKKKEEEDAAAAPAPEPEPTKDQQLLTEIRDLLKNK
jgi:large conductance mechanosensitive channel